jgi:hypothetical protein
LLLANKQDSPASLSVEEIRRDYEEWYQAKIEASRRSYADESGMDFRRERIASLDVMGISALEGYVETPDPLSCCFTDDMFVVQVCERQSIGCLLGFKIADRGELCLLLYYITTHCSICF